MRFSKLMGAAITAQRSAKMQMKNVKGDMARGCIVWGA